MIHTRSFFLRKNEREEKLLQCIQLANGPKARLDATNAESTTFTVTTQENAIKKTFDKKFAIPLDFDFFKHPVYPYGLLEDLIIRLD